jgi:hypothetical protein
MTDLTDTASQLGVKAAEAQARAEELSWAAGMKLDQARIETAGALRNAATSVRTTATGAADKLDATASFVEDHDLRGLFAGCRQLIRRNPAGSFLFATAVGFLAGSAARRILHSCPGKSAGA